MGLDTGLEILQKTRHATILDAKDLLVHSPRVISNTTKRMNDIKLLCYRRWTGSYRVRASRSTVAEGTPEAHPGDCACG